MNRLDVAFARGADAWVRALDPDRPKLRTRRVRRGPFCEEPCPVPPFTCSLLPGHAGRHVAMGFRTVVAAWPGTHRPTPDEMREPR